MIFKNKKQNKEYVADKELKLCYLIVKKVRRCLVCNVIITHVVTNNNLSMSMVEMSMEGEISGTIKYHTGTQ